MILDGERLPLRSPRDSLRRGIALLSNDRLATGLVPSLDVARNVTLASLPRFSPRGWLHTAHEAEAVQRQREALGIRMHSLDQPVAELSGGNQQKVVLARWLETEPEVLLLDEPTRGIDVGAKGEIYELVNRWCERGLAIALVTSELTELLALSDRVLVLHRGRVAAEFAAREASLRRVLRAAMGAEDSV